MSERWVTVVETKAFQVRAKGRLTGEEVEEIIKMIASDPFCGEVMEGTGGIRKVRFAVGNRGKSGGVRVIYYYRNQMMPAFLLSVYAKNEQSNLSKAMRNEMAKVVDAICETYGRSWS